MATWSCELCTFENATGVPRCEICLHPAASPASADAAGDERALKKPKRSGKIQTLLAGVGSSKEQEAARVRRKMEQMRELGIDLPADELLPLLAQNCYCVPVAANAYFERLAFADAADAPRDEATGKRIQETTSYLETSFVNDKGFRLLGKTTMAATITRSGVALQPGDEIVLQAENAGKKRLRPGFSMGRDGGVATAAAPTVNGIVRLMTAQKSQIGRLERDLEVILHPLMKENLVQLGGLCETRPLSTQMFASFDITVFVHVSESAFGIFDEDHPRFYLADAMYALLELMKSRDRSSLSSAMAATNLSSSDSTAAGGDVNAADLDMLFAECAGADDLLTGSERNEADPCCQLESLLHDIELRDHQKQALRWMLWREEQQRNGDGDAGVELEANPMWEERQFRGSGTYYVNPFEKIASLQPPVPPAPCLGGILADDMGMGKTMMMLSLIAYRKHFSDVAIPNSEDANARGDESTESTRTLIVCPLSLLHQWKNEIQERFRANTLKVYVYYGDERDNALSSLKRSDVVLTTYGVLSTEHERTAGKSSEGVLARTKWNRVILDEAHSIKNRMTNYFRACSSLQAQHRWCLTGTPIQNSLDDIFSLLCFLQYEPWSRVAWWKRVISKPYENGEDASALGRLKAVLTPVLLRRTKHSKDKQGRHIVQLPPKHVELVKLEFPPDERAFYQAVYDKSRAEFNGYVSSGSAMSSYVAIFALLLRLRQACDHPLLALGRNFEQVASVSRDGGEGGSTGSSSLSSQFRPQPNETMESYYSRISAQLQQDMRATTSVLNSQQKVTTDGPTGNGADDQTDHSGSGGGLTKAYIDSVMAQVEDGLESQECPICLDPPVNGVLTPCAHLMCDQCLRDSLANDPENGCPVCRTAVDISKVFLLPPPPSLEPSSPSTQVRDKNTMMTVTDATTDSLTIANDDSTALSTAENGTRFLSCKLRQLVRDLELIRRENTAAEKKRKVVVFSQWTFMLEMIADVVGSRGFGHCMFHGSMSQEKREQVLTKFAKDPAIDVLVISLKAGGVGLNLTCASVVILMDPWWNPGVEEQAIDRIHRLGQTEDVIVKRYVVGETVEDMILQLQQRKEKLAKHVLVVAKAHEDKRQERLNLDDLKRFFQ